MSQLKAIVDKLLTNVSNGLYQRDGFIADALFPPIKVKQQSGLIGTYGNDHLRILNTIMAGASPAPRIDANTRSDNKYYIDTHGLSDLVTAEDFANVEKPYDAEKDAVDDLTQLLLIGKERGLAQAMGDVTILTQNETLAGPSQFSDFANSDPLGKFLIAQTTVRGAHGFPPNAAAMDWDVMKTLSYHPQILENLGFTHSRAGTLNEKELAKAMGVEMIFVAKGIFNNSNLGQADSLAPIWGKDIIFFYRPKKAGLKQKSLGYNIQFIGDKPRKVFKNPIMNPPEAKEIIVRDRYDLLLSDVTGAFLYKDAIA